MPANRTANVERRVSFFICTIRRPPWSFCYIDPSVFCGPLHAIDDQEFAGTFGWFEFQPELFLNRGKDRWAGKVKGRGCTSWVALVGRIFQMEIKQPRDPGFVDHRAVQSAEEEF